MLSSDDEVLLMYYLYLQTRRKRYRKTKPKGDTKKMRLNVNSETNLKDIDKFVSCLATELKGMPIQQSRKLRLDIDALVKTAKAGCENNRTETDSDSTEGGDSSSDNDDTSSTSEVSTENQDPLSIDNTNVNRLKTQQNKLREVNPMMVPSENKSVNLSAVKEELEEDLFEIEEYDLVSNTEEGVKEEACIDGSTSTFCGEVPKPMTVPNEICKSLDLDLVKDEIGNDLFEIEDNDLAGKTTDSQKLMDFSNPCLKLDVVKEDIDH